MKKKKIQQKVAKRAPVVQQKRDAEGRDVLTEMIFAHANALLDTVEANSSAKVSKIDKILARIVQDIPIEKVEHIVGRDARFFQICKLQKEAREAGNRPFAEKSLQRMAIAREDELLMEYASKDLETKIRTGDILRYMDKEDKEKMVEVRTWLCLVLDVADTVLNDFTGLVNSLGMNGCFALPTIKQAREEIEKFLSEGMNIINLHAAKNTFAEESDKIYEHIKTRSAIMTKKIDRQLKKLDKEEEDRRKKDLDIINNV